MDQLLNILFLGGYLTKLSKERRQIEREGRERRERGEREREDRYIDR